MAEPQFRRPQAGVSPAGRADGPAIDLVHLSRQTLGDTALERELLTLFAQQARSVMARLAGSPRLELRFVADLVHTLKGSARAVGAGKVAQVAEIVEDEARLGHRVDTAELARAINAALAATTRLLA